MSVERVPADVWREILQYCSPHNITETCRSFASIAYTIPSLWSTVHIGQRHLISEDGPDLLSRRLERARDAPLVVSLGPYDVDAGFEDLCKTLFKFNKRIEQLELTTETSYLAGIALSCIFYGEQRWKPPKGSRFPRLKVLSVRTEDDEAEDAPEWPDSGDWQILEDFLTAAIKIDEFPALQSLAIPCFYDCMPEPPKHASFTRLHTLILDGSLEHRAADIVLVVALLQSMPQLKTFWFKHNTQKHLFRAINDEYWMAKERTDIRGPISLPQLTHLAVTAPGCAVGLLLCMHAPVLRDLHIDCSRGPIKGEEERSSVRWSNFETNAIQRSLKYLSAHSKELRRIAFTSAYLTHENWKWMLFGEGGTPPFPQLESITLHGVEEKAPDTERPCGFNDVLLQLYSQQPTLPLRRLALLRCNFPLRGSVVVRAFESAIEGGASNASYEVDFGPSCPQWTEEDLGVLETIGIKLIRREEGEIKENEWWTHNHRIDPFDSHAY